MVLGENDTHLNGLELEIHPHSFHAVFYKLLSWALGSFLLVLPLTGMTFYLLIESDYAIHATIAVFLLSYIGLFYWITEATKSVYRVDISPSGFTMSVAKTSPFLTTVDGFYAWKDIISYSYGRYSSDDKIKLIINLTSGQSLCFHYGVLKEFGDMPRFYQVLHHHLPEKEHDI